MKKQQRWMMGNNTTVNQNGTLVAAANAFAIRAHEGQKRKGTQFPYVTHPVGVAGILRYHYPQDQALEAAGFLHDVLEDTDITADELRLRFGDDVTDLVLGVTNKGDWHLEDYVDRPRVLRLKAADTLDNILDSIRGLEKGHDVWSRFSAGRRKGQTWRRHADIIGRWLPNEALAARLDEAVTRVEQL